MDMKNQSATKSAISTVTRKGQTTIPVSVRNHLGLSAQDKVLFSIEASGKVIVESFPMTLNDAYGSVQPISRPENFSKLTKIAKQERVENYIRKSKK